MQRFAACQYNENYFTDSKEIFHSQAGSVFLTRFVFDNKKYILKERKLSSPELGKRKNILNEASLLSQLDNEHGKWTSDLVTNTGQSQGGRGREGERDRGKRKEGGREEEDDHYNKL